MPQTRDQVITALQTIRDPQSGNNIVTLNAAKEMRLDGDSVYLRLDPSVVGPALRDSIRRDVESVLRRAGAAEVHVDLATAARAPANEPPANRPLPQVKNFIAVGAGK